jgi:glycolate oxidase iron-sulfur subunit
MVKKFSDIGEDICRCNRCGFCEEVCPTYRVTGEEFSLARGRNRLMRRSLEGAFDLTREPEINHHIYSCLLCGNCVVACPSSVITDTMIKSARAAITAAKGNPFPIRMALHGVLAKQRRLTLGTKVLRFYQRSGARWLARHTGFLGLLGSMGKAEGVLPQIPERTLRDRLPQLLKKPARPKRRVAYFAGCMMNNFFPQVAAATLRVLQLNDIEVIVPISNCCGIPHEAYGESEAHLKLAKENLDTFSREQFDAVITDCSTCAHGLHYYAELLQDDPKYGPLAKEFSAKVKDPSQYLVEVGFKQEMGTINAKVTYHDPCHGVRGIKVKEQPRQIIKSIPGIEFVELDESDWCCGGAGSYNVTHYDISRKILDRKMDNFRKTGAEYLVTACPACLMQLAHGLDVHKLPAKAIHVMQLLDQAYQNQQEKSKTKAG